MKLLTVERSLPVRSPISSGESESSRAIREKATPVSIGLRSSRWMFSIRVISNRRSSGISLTTTGTDCDLGQLGRAPPALPSHQLVAVLHLAHHQRLYNAVRTDRLRQFLQPPRFEDAARLQRVGVDQVGGDVERRFRGAEPR